MSKEEFKLLFTDMFLKYVKFELDKGITLNTSELSDKLWELFENK